MLNRPVISREYKLMLNTDRFNNRAEGAANFFNLIRLLIARENGTIGEPDEKEEKRRQTSYLDTPQFALRQSGFSLRLREEAPDSFQINLKYRASDRYLSAAQDLSSAKKGKIKFEEDILPPFNSKFSHSNTVKTSAMPQLKTIEDVTFLFPGLKNLEIEDNTPFKIANGFIVVEVVRPLCTFQFVENDIIEASLSFWYLETDENFPLVGEFSFTCKAIENKKDKEEDKKEDKLEEFRLETAAGANGFFRALQNHAGWLDLNATTKTSFALETL